MDEKNLTPEFESMLNAAKSYFENSTAKGLEYHQCIVLRFSDGAEKLYSFPCLSVKELITKSCAVLYENKDSTVTNIVCMWDGGSVDVPAHQFIEALCDINPENTNAEILLNSSPVSYIYISKKISDILK